MNAAGHEPSAALLEQLLLGQLPPHEVERMSAELADDDRLAALAERIAPGDPLLASPIGASATRPRASIGQKDTPLRIAAFTVACNCDWLSVPFKRIPLAK